MPKTLRLMLPVMLIMSLTACEEPGIETSAQMNARRNAEGQAIGSACRHAGRAIEDCYQLNTRYSKASIYAGWRDMDTYIRENKIEVILPEYAPKYEPPRIEREVPVMEEAAPAAKMPATAAPTPTKETPPPAADKPKAG